VRKFLHVRTALDRSCAVKLGKKLTHGASGRVRVVAPPGQSYIDRFSIAHRAVDDAGPRVVVDDG
jgi:hypothetical protein